MCELHGLVSSLMVLLLSVPKFMRMELSFTTSIAIRVKKESQSCTNINVKHGGLVLMDIKYMFKTYEAFPKVVYPDPILLEVAAL